MATELAAIEQEEPGPYLGAFVDLGRGEVARLGGRFDDARRLTGQALECFRTLGTQTMTAGAEQFLAWIELSAGDSAAAIEALHRAEAILAELGERSLRSTIQALLARAHEMEHAIDEAQSALELAEELSAPQEAVNYAITHEVRARLALVAGDLDAADRWARSAVEYAFKTDFVDHQAGARLGLARVLAARGRTDEARSEGSDVAAALQCQGRPARRGHGPGAA